MHILVTGGAGYIGSVLVRRLLQRGHRIRLLDRLYWGVEPISDVLDQMEVIHADIREVKDEWFQGVDGVIHLAGLSNDPTANFDPQANWEMNARATDDMAAAARKAGVRRFVFGSSCALYDGLPDGSVYDEEAPIDPRGPYAESKRHGEETLLGMAGADFAPVILRQGTVYGHSPRMRFDLVVNAFVKDALTKGHLQLHGGGTMWRPLVDVQDAADIQIACVEANEEDVSGQIFNVVQENYQVRELARVVKDAVAAVRPQVVLDEAPLPSLVRNYQCSNEKLFQTLGVRPSRSVPQSVGELVEAFGNMDAGALANPRFYNLQWMVLLNEVHASLKPFDYVLRRDEPTAWKE